MPHSNENCQSAKQFSDRKKRLTLKKGYKDKKDKKTNEIKDLNDQIAKLNEELRQKEEELNRINKQELKKFANIYNNNELLSEIFSLGSQTTYSATALNDLRDLCDNGINDDINNLPDIIEELCEIDKRINDEVEHTNSVGDLLDKLGSIVSLSPKGDDENGN